jgi:hypothetical protein
VGLMFLGMFVGFGLGVAVTLFVQAASRAKRYDAVKEYGLEPIVGGCPECGPRTALGVDADLCCRTCGADVAMVYPRAGAR